MESLFRRRYLNNYISDYLWIKPLQDATVSIAIDNSNKTITDRFVSLYYSVDGGISWLFKKAYIDKNGNGLPSGAFVSVRISAGDKILLRGQTTDNAIISCSVPYETGGNPLTIVDFSPRDLFKNSTTLISAEELVLSRTEITGGFPKGKENYNGYWESYYKGKGIYKGMFMGCTSLKYAPKEINLLGIDTEDCYQMFEGCTSLLTAPEIKAKYMFPSRACASMFRNCKELVEGPKIQKDCKIIAPSGYSSYLTTDTFNYMYQGCEKLEKVYAGNVEISERSAMGWLDGVSATGKVITARSYVSTLPSGWTRVSYED